MSRSSITLKDYQQLVDIDKLEEWITRHSSFIVEKYNIPVNIQLKNENIISVSFSYHGENILLFYSDGIPVYFNTIFTCVKWLVEDYIEEQIFQEECKSIMKERKGLES